MRGKESAGFPIYTAKRMGRSKAETRIISRIGSEARRAINDREGWSEEKKQKKFYTG